ncbi:MULTISPECIES: hypothetical protein [unclassified Streptomyces]|uniref:hypothetical protein n=1 Tax=unclassified Streptomyces TaxID=2593676 RepID=UPI002DDAA283|nr:MULTISPECIES: hypothetical protein [unclassified Streptomyces]WSC42527.1 hypothetical protein OHA08_18100 [Streptomyces sp. NBC_01763]WSC59203.1 hypothetical protein OG808_27090 [Streptomyces sp. NBC_01761]WSF90334.1 hypothetical protein OIE70_27185 [Streptomyces sp. NBC_01744]WSJ56533.1 hypothetical protein OG243_27820 [Streptomyces sp. NBC_01318]
METRYGNGEGDQISDHLNYTKVAHAKDDVQIGGDLISVSKLNEYLKWPRGNAHAHIRGHNRRARPILHYADSVGMTLEEKRQLLADTETYYNNGVLAARQPMKVN